MALLSGTWDSSLAWSLQNVHPVCLAITVNTTIAQGNYWYGAIDYGITLSNSWGFSISCPSIAVVGVDV